MAKNVMHVDTNIDWGIEFGEDLSKTITEHQSNAENANAKAQAMYDAIIPLLNNLKKNPEKPNIVWPDRVKKIDQFIKKLDDILSN